MNLDEPVAARVVPREERGLRWRAAVVAFKAWLTAPQSWVSATVALCVGAVSYAVGFQRLGGHTDLLEPAAVGALVGALVGWVCLPCVVAVSLYMTPRSAGQELIYVRTSQAEAVAALRSSLFPGAVEGDRQMVSAAAWPRRRDGWRDLNRWALRTVGDDGGRIVLTARPKLAKMYARNGYPIPLGKTAGFLRRQASAPSKSGPEDGGS